MESSQIEDSRTLFSFADSILLFICGVLVFNMQVGFAMLESGSVQRGHTIAILMKNFLDVCVGAVVWFAIGWAFTFGDGGDDGRISLQTFFGSSDFFLLKSDSSMNGYELLNRYTLFFYQLTFAATAVTILSGGVAERAKVRAYLAFVVLLTTIIYPPIARSVWYRHGWLHLGNDNAFLGGALDIAGSGVVHMVGGVAAIMGARALGYRNRWASDKDTYPPRFEWVDGRWRVNALYVSSEPQAALGVIILWQGWYGFTVGSIGTFVGQKALAVMAGRTVVQTALSPAAGALTMLIATVIWPVPDGRLRAFSLTDAFNGALSGLVAVNSGIGVCAPWTSILCGISAAFVTLGFSRLMLRLRIDDPVDAGAVHGAAGCWGLIFAALFAEEKYVRGFYGEHVSTFGLFMGGGASLLLAALMFSLFVAVWSGTFSYCFFRFLVYVDEGREYPLFIMRQDRADDLIVESYSSKKKKKRKEAQRQQRQYADTIARAFNPQSLSRKFSSQASSGATTPDLMGARQSTAATSRNVSQSFADIDAFLATQANVLLHASSAPGAQFFEGNGVGSRSGSRRPSLIVGSGGKREMLEEDFDALGDMSLESRTQQWLATQDCVDLDWLERVGANVDAMRRMDEKLNVLRKRKPHSNNHNYD